MKKFFKKKKLFVIVVIFFIIFTFFFVVFFPENLMEKTPIYCYSWSFNNYIKDSFPRGFVYSNSKINFGNQDNVKVKGEDLKYWDVAFMERKNGDLPNSGLDKIDCKKEKNSFICPIDKNFTRKNDNFILKLILIAGSGPMPYCESFPFKIN